MFTLLCGASKVFMKDFNGVLTRAGELDNFVEKN